MKEQSPKTSMGDIIEIEGGIKLIITEVIDDILYARHFSNELLPEGPFAMGKTGKVDMPYKESSAWELKDTTMVNNFIGESGWLNPYPVNLDSIKVKILRPCMFFAVDQEITLNKLGEYFTFPAIDKLLHDGFIKYIS